MNRASAVQLDILRLDRTVWREAGVLGYADSLLVKKGLCSELPKMRSALALGGFGSERRSTTPLTYGTPQVRASG